MSYIEIIKTAIMYFPLIAIIISIPFILIEYHKFGSISVLKSFIIYSLILYLMCAYFLVILPLPSISFVKELTTTRAQLIPFTFILDFIEHTSFNVLNINTYIESFKQNCFFVPIYNILLTLPFGIYLRYYFKTNLKKTILYTFLLSLFFELTQLTGLYFIYPRGYRLFDIDDLILNTLGGVIGYLISKILLKHIPDKEEINNKARLNGRKVSGLKRLTALVFDSFIFIFITLLLYLLIHKYMKFEYCSILMIFIYYIVIPYINNGSTLGQRFINVKIVDYKNNNSFFRLLFRRILFFTFYFVIPICLFILVLLTCSININQKIRYIIVIIEIAVIFLIYAITFVKYLFTSSLMLYENLSKTKMVSTIE